MRITNKGKDSVRFRDDAGKHELKPRGSYTVVGDQHLAHILTLPGVVDSAFRPRRASDAD